MKKLRKFLGLPGVEQRLLVTSALSLVAIRLGLVLLPFRTLVGLLNRAASASRHFARPAPITPSRIAWAVMVTSPYVLGVRPCLAQALTARLLLGRRRYPVRVHFGVARVDGGQVQGHAWVECDGHVVIGGSASDLDRYTPLLALDAQVA